MSKYKYEGYGVVRDTEIDFPYHTDDIVDLLDEKDQQITDLEAKLAEEKEYTQQYRKECAKIQTDYYQLKQQLTDKNKEIEYQESMKILAVENQNKNAIEQLEQIINLFEPYENEEKDTILCANNGISFLEFIDNQIKQLKEGK